MGQAPSASWSPHGQPLPALCTSCSSRAVGEQEEAAGAEAPALDYGDAPALTRESSGALRRQSSLQVNSIASTSSCSRAVSKESSCALSSTAAARLGSMSRGSSLEALTMGSLNSLVLIPSIREKLRNFRDLMEREEAPTEDEIARGVHLQKVYDFYDVEARKCRVRKMFDDVLHTRHSRRPEPEPEDDVGSDTSLSDNDLGSPWSSSDMTRTPSERSQEDAEGLGRRASAGGKGFRRANSLSDQARVTMWGVLVGRLMHTDKEFAFDDTMMDSTTVRRRLSGEGVRAPRRVATCMIRRARSVIRRAEAMMKQILRDEEDVFDWEWAWEEEPPLLRHFFGKEYLDTLLLLANTARKMVAEQPVLVELEAPCKIFGDLHGQLRDMLFLFGAFGAPTEKGAPSFVFNGDFVDRGRHQISTLGILLALKVALPDKVWLIRGNHEDKTMNERYGFQEECTRVLGDNFGPKVYETFHKVFDQLPVACLISKRVLVLHGGIGDGSWALRDLRAIRRPLGTNELADPTNRWIMNLLWSDPIEEDDSSLGGVFGVHPSPRGTLGLCFAWDLTRQFCARNGLGLIVRSHQSKQGSLGFDIMHDNMLVRVFSARDYEEHGNDGALLMVRPSHYGKLLSVRPQVLRSATKASDEAIVRKLGTDSDHPPTRRENMAMMRASLRREALRRKCGPGRENEQGFKGWLWRLKENGKRTREADWSWEKVCISRNGALVSSSCKDTTQGAETLLVEPGGLALARIAKVSSGQVCQTSAFQVVFQKGDGEVGRLVLASETRQERSKWMGELRKLSSG